MRLVPVLSARALGAFRIALGAAMVWAISGLSIPATPREFQRHLAFPDLEIIHALAVNAQAIHWVQAVSIGGAILFAAGLFTRLALAVVVLGTMALALAMLEYGSVHHLGIPLITMLGWLTVRWGDALSVDRLRARSSQPPTGPRAVHGFAVWWPGLVVGLALFSAGYAKLALSGLGWITSGAVRYHFVTDSPNAPVTWGLWIATHPRVAVLASGAAVAAELSFIVLALLPFVWARFAALAAGGALFLGLYLFQGIYWPAWMMLFLAFAPWFWLDRRSVGDADYRISAAQVVAITAIVAVQAYAVAFQYQVEPFVSNFPMYSGTFESPADYDSRMNWRVTRLDAARGDGRDILPFVKQLIDDEQIDLIRLAENAAGTKTVVPGTQRTAWLCEAFVRYGAIPKEVTVDISRGGFDWAAGKFREAYVKAPTGGIPLATLCKDAGTAPRPRANGGR